LNKYFHVCSNHSVENLDDPLRKIGDFFTKYNSKFKSNNPKASEFLTIDESMVSSREDSGSSNIFKTNQLDGV